MRGAIIHNILIVIAKIYHGGIVSDLDVSTWMRDIDKW